MLVATVLELNYCRLLLDEPNIENAEGLLSDYDYCFAVFYGVQAPDIFEKVAKNACVIDLSRGAEFAFSHFQATTRNQVRRTEKIEGLSFRRGIPGDFNAYFSFYQNCEKARGWYPVPEQELHNSLIFTAFFNGQPISGMSVYAHEGRLRIGRIFSMKRLAQEAALNNLVFGCSARRLVFDICRYGAGEGFHTLDLGGIDPGDASKSGINMFKQSFGGAVVPVTLARYRNERFVKAEPLIRQAGYDIT